MALIRHPKDFWAGVLFIGVGAFAIVHGVEATRSAPPPAWGPGYFPRILGHPADRARR